MFRPNCLPILIGSLPLQSHAEAVALILSHSPQIPLWPQLPKLQGEGMVRQFLNGFPGLRENESSFWIDNDSEDFPLQMTNFYEDLMRVEEDGANLRSSRFQLGDETAPGFSALMEGMTKHDNLPIAMKGQITGPVTTGVGVQDAHGQHIFADDNLRDILIKHLSYKARWQIEEFKKIPAREHPIIFIDEPALVSFGSSGFMSISKEIVTEAVDQIIASIHEAGGLAGIHICANGDWDAALSSTTDILSFDAYFFFDNFILFKQQIREYLERGGMLAWGIVPTSDQDILKEVSSKSLYNLWLQQVETISTFGISKKQIMQQTLISPSCGTGSLPPDLAVKVLQLTRDISSRAREELMQA